METIFLSYTYNPHPDYKAATDSMERNLRRVIETFGLRVVDGVDLGGDPLRPEILKRIDSSDALIALMTPQADAAGTIVPPAFVISEFQHANGHIPTLQIVHDKLQVPAGLAAADEYQVYRENREFEVLLKVMNTIALWKRELGRTVKLGIEPHDLARRFERTRDICEYRILRDSTGQETNWQPSPIWVQKGSAVVLVPNVRDDEFVRIRVRIDRDPWWISDFTQPFVGTAKLEPQP